MTFTSRLLAGTALAFTLALPVAAPVAAEDAALGTVLATVNGTDITLGELLIARAGLPQDYDGVPAQTLYDGLLKQMIDQQLLADTLAEAPERLTLALRNQERSLKAGEVVNELLADAVTDEELQALYAETFGTGEAEQEFSAAHILVETEEDAKAIIAELEAGADFAELAREKSTGPSGPSGGELGWFSKGMMVPAFEAAVVALEPGSISAPVETQFGWHVVKLHETRAKPVPGLEEVRANLTEQITSQKIAAHIAELTDAATITRNAEIAPESVNQIDLLD